MRGVDGEVASGMHYLKFVQLTFQTGKICLAMFVVEMGRQATFLMPKAQRNRGSFFWIADWLEDWLHYNLRAHI